jgi:hypothetical protein
MAIKESGNKELLKFAREALEKELVHYLDKLWKVFSWASTILVSIIGGVIALRFRENDLTLSLVDKSGLVFAILVLSITTVLHLDLILSFEMNTRDKLEVCDKELGISKYTLISRDRPDRNPRSKWVSYKAAIILLALAAVFTIVFGA